MSRLFLLLAAPSAFACVMTIVRYQHRLAQINASRRRHLFVAQAVASSTARYYHSRRYFASNSRWGKLIDSLTSTTANLLARAREDAARAVSGASEKATNGMKSAAAKATDDVRHLATRSTTEVKRAIEECARDVRESARNVEEKIRNDIIDRKESARAIATSALSRAKDRISNRISSIIPSTAASVISRLRDGISRRMPSLPSMSHMKQRTVEMSTVAIRWLWWWGLAAVGVYGISTTATKEGMRMLKEEMAATTPASLSLSSTPSREEEHSKSEMKSTADKCQ